MSFKESVSRDLSRTFLNDAEFAERLTVRYDGEAYAAVSLVRRGLTLEERAQLKDDHEDGFYKVKDVVHCALSDIGGVLPEQGKRFWITDPDGYEALYRIASAREASGMVTLYLEDIDE